MSTPNNYLAFTLKHNGIANRIITPVKIAAVFDPKNPPASPKFIDTTALWDTGATRSVITDTIAKALGLTPVGKVKVHHAGGEGDYDTHLVNLVLPNNVGIEGVLVSECPDVTGGFGVIIGMDIICTGDLSITNHKGATWMTFRFPSIGTHDYVQDSKARPATVVRTEPKVGRNEPCPCGSGKKYKKCCGA